MKKMWMMIGVCGVLVVSCLGLKAQSMQSCNAVTHFFIVNLDENMADVLNFLQNEKKTDNFMGELLDKKAFEEIMDTFYTIFCEKFKNEFGINLLPLRELQNKIKYNSHFPTCPDVVNIKKVIKNASGYKYYTDFFVNIFSDLSAEYPAKPSLMRIKPIYALCFNLYDSNGALIRNICFSYKSKKSLAETRHELNKTIQEMKAELSEFYSDALNEFTALNKSQFATLQ